jgi:hypothetical protein
MCTDVSMNHIKMMLDHYADADMCMGDEFTFLNHVDTERLWKIKGLLSILSEAVDERIDYRNDMDNQYDSPPTQEAIRETATVD